MQTQHILRRRTSPPPQDRSEAAERLFQQRKPEPTPAPAAVAAHQAEVEARAHERKRKPPPPGETRRGSFLRLINKRVPEAIDQITLVGNLSNRKNYAYSQEDVDQIEAALLEAVKLTIAAFRNPSAMKPSFRLDDGNGTEG